MFYNYEIHNNGKEDILYLYLTMKYEFSNEFNLEDENDLKRRTKNFIQSNHIPFRGNHIYLIVDGIVVKSIDISKTIYNFLPSSYSSDSFMISIKLDDQSICEISLREYLISILFSYFDLNLHDEVLKCICILYNGYCYKMMKEHKIIVSSDEFHDYKPISYYKVKYFSFESISKRFNSIISEVDSIFLGYKNDYILPFIHYSNCGKTSTNSLYPYLSSVQSLWDLASPYYINVCDFSYQELNRILNLSLDNHSTISIIVRKNSQRIMFENKTYTIKELQKIFHLKSNNMYFIIYQNFLRVITFGLGDSFGFSIFGANEIAKSGTYYYNILNYYFPKTQLFQYVKELSS